MMAWFAKHRDKITFCLIVVQVMVLAVFSNCSAADPVTPEATMSVLETAITFVWTQFTEMATLVTSKPILLLPVAIFAAGAAIGLVKRLIS